MNSRPRIGCCVFLTILAVLLTGADKRRNPFGLPDIVNPVSDGAKSLADQVPLAGGKDDVNAKDWTVKAVVGNPMFLDGEWSSRWNSSGGDESWAAGTAKIRLIKDRLFIHYKGVSGSNYLIEAVRVGDKKLIGAYVTAGNGGAGSPWVGRIVDGERIDGIWSTNGARWDFRRRAVRKLPKPDRSK